jgi:hypothetical protein
MGAGDGGLRLGDEAGSVKPVGTLSYTLTSVYLAYKSAILTWNDAHKCGPTPTPLSLVPSKTRSLK